MEMFAKERLQAAGFHSCWVCIDGGFIENHRDLNVRRALLHTIKITKDQKALDGLYLLLEKNNLPIEFQEEIDKTIEEIGFVTA